MKTAAYRNLDEQMAKHRTRRRQNGACPPGALRYEPGEVTLNIIELVQRLCLAGAPMTVKEIVDDLGLTTRSIQRFLNKIRNLTTLDLVTDLDLAGVERHRIRGLVREPRAEMENQ